MDIDGSTRILAVIGHPVAHSFSPRMHNAAIDALGLNLRYVAFHVLPERVGEAVAAARALDLLGMNVTIPHKQAVIPYLDDLSEEARRVGAVNTILHSHGRLIGHNTDVYGVLNLLRETAGLPSLPETVVVLGASGAARGVVYGLCRQPEVRTVRILNRTVERAERLAREMSAHGTARMDAAPLGEESLRAALADAGLLINATSVGMSPNEGESPAGDGSTLHAGLAVVDIVFNPRETLLMRQARAAGARATGGLDMLVYQGARSFEIWTGIAPPVDIMRRAIAG